MRQSTVCLIAAEDAAPVTKKRKTDGKGKEEVGEVQTEGDFSLRLSSVATLTSLVERVGPLLPAHAAQVLRNLPNKRPWAFEIHGPKMEWVFKRRSHLYIHTDHRIIKNGGWALTRESTVAFKTVSQSVVSVVHSYTNRSSAHVLLLRFVHEQPHRPSSRTTVLTFPASLLTS